MTDLAVHPTTETTPAEAVAAPKRIGRLHALLGGYGIAELADLEFLQDLVIVVVRGVL